MVRVRAMHHAQRTGISSQKTLTKSSERNQVNKNPKKKNLDLDDEQEKETDYYYAETMQAIADELGVSRSAVQQIERRAFKKLRKALKNRGINSFED